MAGKKSGSLLESVAVAYAWLGLCLALFTAGQLQLFRGRMIMGFSFSVVAVLLGLSFYLQGILPVALGKIRKDGRSPRSSRIGKASRHSPPWRALKPASLARIVGAVLGLALAGIGQSFWVQTGNGSTLAVGSWFFLAASALFLGSFRPWKREGSKPFSLPWRVELGLLGTVLLIAAFLRAYQIDTIPSGLFIDQGFQGYSAQRILHEGWRPFYVEDIFHAYSLALYQLAFWFGIFGAGEVSLKLFYAFLGLLGFPLVYWTFRQLAGPRMALLSLFILAVMRWNINFSRNGFPTVQMTLYMFGTIAFLLYAIRRERDADQVLFHKVAMVAAFFFVVGVFPFAFQSLFWTLKPRSVTLAVAAVVGALGLLGWMVYALKASKDRDTLMATLLATGFFAAGFYTYQAYKVFPLLVLAWAFYEVIADRAAIRKKWRYIVLFAVAGIFLILPVLGNPQTRETELSIFTRVHLEHSWKPFWEVLSRTAIMFNRLGDPNARHNLQDQRMLDDVSGTLFILGLAYCLARVGRRPSFYVLAGFFIMSLPCILSIDAAHANRLFALTPFIAFLVASPLEAIWGRMRETWGLRGEWIFLALVAPFLGWMTAQNFKVYFHDQARSFGGWHEYAPQETEVGRIVARNGAAYDYYVSPRYYNYYTIDFLGYGQLDHIHSMLFPEALISHGPDTSRGLYYAMEEGRSGYVPMLKYFYPEGRDRYLVDPLGNTAESFYHVEADAVAKERGLKVRYDRPVEGKTEGQVVSFPSGLPKGPYRAALWGQIYIPVPGRYSWKVEAPFRTSFQVGKKAAAENRWMIRGYYPVKFEMDVPAGTIPDLKIEQIDAKGLGSPVTPGSFTNLPPFRGLKGEYFRGPVWDEMPFLAEYDPIVNFTNGNDFSAATNAGRWTGKFRAPRGGEYKFFVQMDGQAELRIDGKPIGERQSRISLAPGLHALDLRAWRSGNNLSSLSLYWIPPGGSREVMPCTAFEEVP
ncbi:MAG TPA: PA14 domain-containing protein [bacterium]|nr:PA14 domain-containing protein [bacterium]